MSRRMTEEELFESVMSKLMKIRITYKGITDIERFKLGIKNIVRPLFRNNPYKVLRSGNSVYIGTVMIASNRMCIPNGIGIQIRYDNGGYKIGHWERGDFSGFGICQYQDGSKYIGQLDAHKFNGPGKSIIPGKSRFEGNWWDGKKNGTGFTYRYKEGTDIIQFICKGNFKDGKYVGWHLESDVIGKNSYIITFDDYTNEAIDKILLPRYVPLNELRNMPLSKFKLLLPPIVSVSSAVEEMSISTPKNKPKRYKVNLDDHDDVDDADVEIIEDCDDCDDCKVTKETNLCKICFENEIDTTILECGHVAICFECYDNPYFVKKKGCPICRKTITRVVKTYKS